MLLLEEFQTFLLLTNWKAILILSSFNLSSIHFFINRYLSNHFLYSVTVHTKVNEAVSLTGCGEDRFISKSCGTMSQVGWRDKTGCQKSPSSESCSAQLRPLGRLQGGWTDAWRMKKIQKGPQVEMEAGYRVKRLYWIWQLRGHEWHQPDIVQSVVG